MGWQFRWRRPPSPEEVKAAFRRLLAVLPLLTIVLSAVAGDTKQLAFLRPYKPVETEDVPQDTPRAEDVHVSRRSVKASEFYDPANPDLIKLQRHDEAAELLPKDAIGFPDWMRALREGTIQPKAGLAPGATMNILDLDVIMKNTKEMPNVRFPHKPHTMWLDCSNCHPYPFEARAGSTQIVMADIFRGKYCGMCHDRVAFITFFSCQRCHSVPRTAEPPVKR